MSQARVTTVAKSRKEWTCGKCRETIAKGEGVRHFAVGFRGMEQHRCTKSACTPSRSELESSATASIYDVIDNVDLSSPGSLEDLYAVRDEVVQAFAEVASEYDSNEMIDVNYDLQERRDALDASGSEIEDWEPDTDEPQADDEATEEEAAAFEDEYAEWLSNARQSLRDAIDNVEVP